MSFLPLIVIMLLMYMFLIRPQQKRAKEQQALVRSLAPGDEVLLNSGIHGVVKEVEEENGVIWLEVAQDLQRTRAPSTNSYRQIKCVDN